MTSRALSVGIIATLLLGGTLSTGPAMSAHAVTNPKTVVQQTDEGHGAHGADSASLTDPVSVPTNGNDPTTAPQPPTDEPQPPSTGTPEGEQPAEPTPVPAPSPEETDPSETPEPTPTPESTPTPTPTPTPEPTPTPTPTPKPTPTPAPVVLTSVVPKISGTPSAGKNLTVVPGTWKPAGVRLKYQWLRDGKLISGATASKYKMLTSDRGKKITVRATGTLTGSATKTATSAAVTVLRILTTKQSSIGGTSKWHKYLSVKPSGWTSGTKFTYQWYRNGKAIKESRARKSSLQIWNADWCQTITVRVTGTKSGYEPSARTSKALTNAGCPKAGYHRIYAGQRMDPGQQIASTNWKHGLRIEKNGSGYLFNHGRARWGVGVGASASKMFLTPDGNLVIKKGNTVKWQSRTAGKGVSYVAVNASGELGLYRANGTRVWTASGHNGYRWNNWGTPHLSQLDGRWASRMIGGYRFGPVGCVPTAFAMAAQSYGVWTDPYSVGVQMHNRGDFNRGVAGAGGRSIVAAGQAYGLAATPLTSQDQIRKALRNNQPVIALVAGPSSITSPGSTHAIVLNGLSGNNTTVTNPWGGIANQTWSVTTLWNWQSWDSLDRNAGAVFWAIG